MDVDIAQLAVSTITGMDRAALIDLAVESSFLTPRLIDLLWETEPLRDLMLKQAREFNIVATGAVELAVALDESSEDDMTPQQLAVKYDYR